MTRAWFESLKPAASARVHLLLAALMWSTVGGVLLVLGVLWALHVRTPLTVLLLVACGAGGFLKAHYVLEPVARRTVERIEVRGDGRCVGGFLSPQSWAMVAAMMLIGRLLRGGALSARVIGLVYVLVGTALLVAVRVLWAAWRRHPAGYSTDNPR
jgi:hypothetical protein